MPDDFNLYATIREHLDASDNPDPHVVAGLVADAVPARQRGAVLRQVLPDAVRHAIRSRRSQYVAELVEPPQSNGRRGMGEVFADPTRARVYVPGAGWKFEVACTADDCEAIAEDYRRRADQNAALADKWLKRAKQMRDTGAATLADLVVSA